MTSDPVRPARVIIPYVRQRMAERGIPEEAIDWVLQNYHTRRPAGARQGSRPAEILIGDFEGRTLRVYVERDSNPPKIKTVVWEG